MNIKIINRRGTFPCGAPAETLRRSRTLRSIEGDRVALCGLILSAPNAQPHITLPRARRTHHYGPHATAVPHRSFLILISFLHFPQSPLLQTTKFTMTHIPAISRLLYTSPATGHLHPKSTHSPNVHPTARATTKGGAPAAATRGDAQGSWRMVDEGARGHVSFCWNRRTILLQPCLVFVTTGVLWICATSISMTSSVFSVDFLLQPCYDFVGTKDNFCWNRLMFLLQPTPPKICSHRIFAGTG